jgi:hypothetical protein
MSHDVHRLVASLSSSDVARRLSRLRNSAPPPLPPQCRSSKPLATKTSKFAIGLSLLSKNYPRRMPRTRRLSQH